MDKETVDYISNIISDIVPVGMEEPYIRWDDADKAATKILSYLYEEGLLIHTEPSN